MIRLCGFWVQMTILVTIGPQVAGLAMSSMLMIEIQDILALTQRLVTQGNPKLVIRPSRKKRVGTLSSMYLLDRFPPRVVCHVICINPTCLLIPSWVTPCGTMNLTHLRCSPRNRSIQLTRKSERPTRVIPKERRLVGYGRTLIFQKMSQTLTLH